MHQNEEALVFTNKTGTTLPHGALRKLQERAEALSPAHQEALAAQLARQIAQQPKQ